MRRTTSFWGTLLVLLAFALPDAAQERKISDTQGGFTGVLDDFDSLGYAVASIGDLDGDGTGDIAVGAPGDDDGGPGRGAVWILFLEPDQSVRAHQKISQTAGGFTGILGDGDGFGRSITCQGDVDGDGVPDLAVGAPAGDDGAFLDIGAVWILFLNSDGTVKGHQKLDGSNGTVLCMGNLWSGGFFGLGVANVGDLDGNGVNDLAVGNPVDVDNLSHPGAVWVLLLHTDGTVLSCSKIAHGQGGFGGFLGGFDFFGAAVSGLGDVDGDGIGDLAIGAYQDFGGGVARGSCWVVFLDTDGSVQGQQEINDVVGGFTGTLADNGLFGVSVAGAGDLDGDGTPDLAVGDIDETGGQFQGAVWLLFLEPDGNVASHVKLETGACGFGAPLDPGDLFGIAVAGMDDLDGDGIPELLVGASGDADGGPNRGSAWIVHPFGRSIGRDGNTLSVAAGGSRQLCLQTLPALDGAPYLLLGSLSGTNPGFLVGGERVPLNVDAYLRLSFRNPAAANLAGSMGLVGGGGAASSTFTLPPGSPAGLIGSKVHFAYVVLRVPSAGQGGKNYEAAEPLIAEWVTGPTSVTFVP